MTTKVTIEACCAPEKQVFIRIDEEGQDSQITVLQNGESTDFVVYDNRSIHVEEMLKDDADVNLDASVEESSNK